MMYSCGNGSGWELCLYGNENVKKDSVKTNIVADSNKCKISTLDSIWRYLLSFKYLSWLKLDLFMSDVEDHGL